MSKIALISILILISSVYCQKGEWEKGVDRTVSMCGPRTARPVCPKGVENLMVGGGEAGITVDTTIKFKHKFSMAPQILTMVYMVHMPQVYHGETGFKVRVKSVTTKGFTLSYTATTRSALKGIWTRWLAVNDPRVDIGAFEVVTPELNNNEDKFKVQKFVVDFNHKFKNRPNVALFVTGVTIASGNALALADVEETYDDRFKVAVKSYWKTAISAVRITYIAGPSTILLPNALGAHICDKTIPEDVRCNKNPLNNENSQKVTIGKLKDARTYSFAIEQPLPQRIMRLINQKRAVSIVGFRGFDVDDSNSDARLFARLTSVGNSQSVAAYTWGKTNVWATFFTQFTYIPPRKCVIFFSKCEFKGQAYFMCNNQEEVLVPRFRIRSIKIPDGTDLELFNQTYFRGKPVILKKSVACIGKDDKGAAAKKKK